MGAYAKLIMFDLAIKADKLDQLENTGTWMTAIGSFK